MPWVAIRKPRACRASTSPATSCWPLSFCSGSGRPGRYPVCQPPALDQSGGPDRGTELTVIAAAILGGTSLFGGAGSVVKTLAGALAALLADQRLQHPQPWRQLPGPDRRHRGGGGGGDLHGRRQGAPSPRPAADHPPAVFHTCRPVSRYPWWRDTVRVGKTFSCKGTKNMPTESHHRLFSGKVAFVTGAGSGIGRATVLAFVPRRAPSVGSRRHQPEPVIDETIAALGDAAGKVLQGHRAALRCYQGGPRSRQRSTRRLPSFRAPRLRLQQCRHRAARGFQDRRSFPKRPAGTAS